MAEHALYGRRSAQRSETAAKGAPSSVVFALDSPLAKLAFGGALALGDKPSVEGDLTASVPSIAALAAFLDTQAAGRSGRQRHCVTAKVKGAAGLTDPRRREVDQRRTNRWKARSRSATRGPSSRLRHARGGNAGARTAVRTAGANLRAVGPLEPETLPVRAVRRNLDLDLRLSAAHLDVYGLRSPTPPHP